MRRDIEFWLGTHMGLLKSQIIPRLIREFKLSDEDAELTYREWRDKFVRIDYDMSILCEDNILFKSENERYKYLADNSSIYSEKMFRTVAKMINDGYVSTEIEKELGIKTWRVGAIKDKLKSLDLVESSCKRGGWRNEKK